MKVQFTGTGAADWPRRAGETEERVLQSLTIDGCLLVDANSYASTEGILGVVQSHSHDDHFDRKTIDRLPVGTPFLGDAVFEKLLRGSPCRFLCAEIGKPVEIAGYRVTPFAANHTTDDPDEQPMCYIIEKDGKTVFYGCDGASFTCRTWKQIRDRHFDLMICDGTFGETPGDVRIFEHNDLRSAEAICQTVYNVKMLNEGGKIIFSHFSRNHQLHGDELRKRFAEMGALTADDGMILNI